MDYRSLCRFLEDMGPMPLADGSAKDDWLDGKDVATLLLNSVDDDALVYLNHSFGNTYCYLNSALVSNDRLSGEYIDDILNWNFLRGPSWSYSSTRTGTEDVFSVSPPLSNTRSKILDGSEPLLFQRSFEGHSQSSYWVLNQKIEQMLDIHHVEERKAYCRFDENGDYEDVIILDFGRNLCTIKKSDLNLLMLITNSTLVRVFDFSRKIDAHDVGDYSERDTISNTSIKHAEIHARRGFWSKGNEKVGCAIRGFQLLSISEPKEDLVKRANREQPERNYESFISWDIKHNLVHECSSNPDDMDSYFTDTGKPFQTTIAFFNPDVLTKYKQHPEKYKVGPSWIYCRGAWSLQRYDVNSEGQVNVLLCDIAHLPYNEQRYWKYFNEEPKAGISQRSYTQDFKGEFSDEHDSLISLTNNLSSFPLAAQSGKPVPIWEYRGDQANRKTSQLHRVLTESPKEWEDQIIELTKIIVDGLNVKSLRKIAQSLNCDDPSFGSIKLLEKVLAAKSVDAPTVEKIVKPIRELNETRSSGVAHAGRPIPKGDLKKQFDATLDGVDEAMALLRHFIEKGLFNIQPT